MVSALGFSIIHFSDIHIVDEHDKILNRIKKIQTACASAVSTNSDVIITISGDIAYSGQKSQYKLAKTFFDELIQYLKEEKKASVYLVSAPGNHDCDFSSEKSTRKTLINSARLDEIDEDYYKSIVEVQKEYLSFANSYNIKSTDILTTKEFIVNNERILFVLVNTSWMSVLDERPGSIIIPHHLFPTIKSTDYKLVLYVYHHPNNWLNPDYKQGFIDHIRQNADMILVGHEHSRDSYEEFSDSFSVYCSHGKELQDNKSENSAFSILSFDNTFQNFQVLDFKWNGKLYESSVIDHQYHKNIASNRSVFSPNSIIINSCKDIGIIINHFSKDEIYLPDLFVWPDMDKCDYMSVGKCINTIRSDIYGELCKNNLNIMMGDTTSCKTTIAKMLFLKEKTKDTCCLLINGSEFTSSNEIKIKQIIETIFKKQYSEEMLEEFRQLPKKERMIIVDDFDNIKINKNRRSRVLDFLYGYFGKVTIFLSTNMDFTSILTSNTISSMDNLYYYYIRPFGNKKRNELISKWYNLDDEHSEEEISKRIEDAQIQINTFLGNGAAIIPAMPVFIISALQQVDASKQIFEGSKYGFLYESLILKSLSKISSDYNKIGVYNLDINVLSKLAFDMLIRNKTYFTEEEWKNTISELSDVYLLDISYDDLLKKMIEVKILYRDRDISNGMVYRFKYPYIYYYFTGRYIAYHLNESNVKQKIKYMSAKLYNETYGNIIIFVCHFANSIDVIDDILENAYKTLEDYQAFDFQKSNPIFDQIKEVIELLVPKVIVDNSSVSKNKEQALIRMDNAGINDGHVDKGEEIIDDEISDKEKDLAAVSSALKTIEVLGQILQNYPMEIKRDKKIEIIDEIHKLGMLCPPRKNRQ